MKFFFWRRKKREEELDDEIESHLRMAAQDRVERGESSEQAEEFAVARISALRRLRIQLKVGADAL